MSLQSRLIPQFHHPSGWLGKLAGWIMATRKSNLERNQWTVDLLHIRKTDHVLELGPGPGVTLGLLTGLAPDGLVVGLDHSKTMLAECGKRNRKAVSNNKLALIQGTFTALPELPAPFDKIIAVNSLQFDGMTDETLSRVTGLLKPGGTIAITFQPRGAEPTDEKAIAFGRKVAGLLETVGLINVRVEQLPMEPVCAVCVLGDRQ
jgi:ubiquinone/menaquinone biosynthesis C-methylase UbiE